jgi:NAD-dependent SIR2 family protein deacetylase
MPHPTPWIGFEDLVDLLRDRSVVVLSGAGVSTESGIPDYRGPETRATKRNPIRYQAFVGEDTSRRHYWGRSAIGWPSFRTAQPNAGHAALAQMEAAGLVSGIITQNVDRLHQKAGSERVIELHGALAEVECLDCGALSSRDWLQERLLGANPGWTEHAAALAPDGDAEIPRSATRRFRVPTCTACGGTLKPHVVFFGENVPRTRVEAAFNMLARADVLLVVGSSLTVFSGFRFVRRAVADEQAVAIVNLGETRGTPLATMQVEGRTGSVLPALADALLPAPAAS